MPHHKKLSVCEKSIIVALNKENLSSRAIADKIGFSHTAVANFLKKYQRTGALERKKGSARKRSTTVAVDRIKSRISLANRFKTAVDIRAELIESGHTEVSVQTIRQRLRSSGLVARSPAKKHF